MEDKLYTAAMAAKEVGVTKIYIRKAIERKQLTAELVGGVWIIRESDLQAWNASRKRHNYPKGT